MSNLINRIRSIDAFRAVTMFLMIFVNDLDGVPNTPEWIKHAAVDADALGLADTIFPAFLFIVGLSIPYAFEKRLRKEDAKIPMRIITRSFALVFIGFFGTTFRYFSIDALIGLVIGIWIIFTGYKIGKDNVKFLMGDAPSQEFLDDIKERVLQIKGIKGVHDIRAHYVGTLIQITIHIEVDKKLTVREAHLISKKVSKGLERLKTVHRVFVHIDPV